MPKVRGPLFSISATGTFRDLLVYRTTGDETTVARPRQVAPPRSIAQQAQATRFRNAVTGWAALSINDKAGWAAAAVPYNLTGYQLYLREYQLQNITPPAQPTLP